MEITVNNYDISMRRTDSSHKIENFKGRVAQVVIDTNDEYRPVIMDGVTLGGKVRAALLESAPFKVNPTVPVAESIDACNALEDNVVLPKGDVRRVAKNVLSNFGTKVKKSTEDTVFDNLKDNDIGIVYGD